MGGHVLWGQLGRLIRLGVDPAEGLHFLFKEGKEDKNYWDDKKALLKTVTK